MAKREWSLDAAARQRIDAALTLITESHVLWPKCVVCGQHAALDKHGCCSKTTGIHLDHREGK